MAGIFRLDQGFVCQSITTATLAVSLHAAEQLQGKDINMMISKKCSSWVMVLC